MRHHNGYMDRELPKSAAKLYAIGEMHGWMVKAVWAEGPFQLASKEYQTSLSIRFTKRGKYPCAAIFLDGKWDAGMLSGAPGVVRTQKNLVAYLAGELDIEEELKRIYPYDPAWDEPKKDEYVQVGKIKMTVEEFHRQAKPYVKRVVPDWVKDKRK